MLVCNFLCKFVVRKLFSMTRKIYFVLLILSFSMATFAQVNELQTLERSYKSADYDVVRAYLDSLSLAKERIMLNINADKKTDAATDFQRARLFLPLTYHQDIIHNAFNLKDNDAYANHLLDIYLHRPSLVKTTDRELRGKQAASVDVETPIQQEFEIVDKVAPTPVESDFSPIQVMVRKPKFWTYKGDYSLQFLQNYFSDNWYKGGESSYSALAATVFEANYSNKQKVKWDNRLELKFGLQSTKSDSLHSFKTTDDLIRLTSKFGLQASKKWYYSVQFVGYTQFTHSHRSNDPKLYSDILAPLNLNLSLGMDYTIDWLNHKLKGNAHFAPLAYNIKYTRLLDLSERLGIDKGKHIKHDYGSEMTIDFKWQLMEALTWKSRLYAYTTYKRMEVEWENTFKFQFNKYIGAQIFIYPRFDDGVTRDNSHGYWQLKEFASIGFQYSF